MNRTCTAWVGGLLSIIFAIGCASSDETLRESEYVVAQLRSEGLVLMRTGMSSDDVFSVPGERFQVAAGGTLHLFEYGDESRAELDASRANPGIMSDAHVYRLDNVVAVYVGGNLSVRSAIAAVFGAELY